MQLKEVGSIFGCRAKAYKLGILWVHDRTYRRTLFSRYDKIRGGGGDSGGDECTHVFS